MAAADPEKVSLLGQQQGTTVSSTAAGGGGGGGKGGGSPAITPKAGAGGNPNEAISAARTVFYVTFNILAATCIVFANKLVLSPSPGGYGWGYVYALTFLHTATSWTGMGLFAAFSFFQRKHLPKLQLLPLAVAYVGYVVLNNLSLQVNQVGFYQLTKICIAPVVLALEVTVLGRRVTKQIVASVFVVCLGVAGATLADKSVMSSVLGVAVGFAAVLVTAMYQLWAGTYQRSMQASSMQLLDQYCPLATVLLMMTSLAADPWGFASADPGTIRGYEYTLGSTFFILLSCVLGLAVNLSTFLVIGATSSLTYNIVGHIKTVLILAGGCLIFGDTITLPKFGGICLAMTGIVWYSHLQLSDARDRAAASMSLSAAKQLGTKG